MIISFGKAVRNRESSRLKEVASQMEKQATVLREHGYLEFAELAFQEHQNLLRVIEELNEVQLEDSFKN